MFLQFHDQNNVSFAFEGIVQLKKTRMLKCFHDFDFIQSFHSILFFVNLNEFRCEQMFRGSLATFFHFTKFASRIERGKIVDIDRRTETRQTFREIPSVRIHRPRIYSFER